MIVDCRLHQSVTVPTLARFTWWLVPVMIAIAAFLGAAQPARAAAYQGIYTIIDPYLASNISALQTAAQTPCSSPTAQSVTPFCGASNGILLRLPWCDFQLYHARNSAGQPAPSCHYSLQFSNGYGSPGQQVTFGDETSPCAGKFDTCSGSTNSILGGTLRLVQRIDTQRAASGLPPLNLSVGMFAGIGTPQSVLDTVGSVDVPGTLPPDAPGVANCVRLPLAWKPQFTAMYSAALDQLLAYINSRFPTGANITIVKAANITGDVLEVQMPGLAAPTIVPSDPGPAGLGGPLQCSSTIAGAVTWLNAYNAAPLPGQNFSEAVETAFGSAIGHLWGSLANGGLSQAILSLAVTNGTEFASIDCGVSGATACSVQPSSGNWSEYYFLKYVQDVFDGGLAQTAAAKAFSAVRSGTFLLAPAQLSINSTSLVPSPAIITSQELSCTMNNTNPVDAPTLTLNQTVVQILGVGTQLGWQTENQSGAFCSIAAPNYGTALQNAIDNGALYLEIEADAAFSDIAACSPFLDPALTEILQRSPPESCFYP